MNRLVRASCLSHKESALALGLSRRGRNVVRWFVTTNKQPGSWFHRMIPKTMGSFSGPQGVQIWAARQRRPATIQK